MSTKTIVIIREEDVTIERRLIIEVPADFTTVKAWEAANGEDFDPFDLDGSNGFVIIEDGESPLDTHSTGDWWVQS